jgi:multiple antibiotic resistance protein
MHDIEYLKYLAGLVAIVNPVGTVPVFIGLTVTQSARERARTALIAASTVAVVLSVALLTGEAILHFFGIGIASFRVGGGILVLLIAISMLHARISPTRQTEEEAQDAAEKESVGVVPIGVPLLAGPGAISTIILYAARSNEVMHYVLLQGLILLVAAIIYTAFRAAPMIAGWLGRTGVNVVTRIMGLILAAIAVEIMANGLKQLFPGLA